MTQSPMFANAESVTLGISDTPREKEQRNRIVPVEIKKACKFYPTADGTPVHVKTLQDVADQASVELVRWVEWLNEQGFDEKIQFVLEFDDHNAFDACISKEAIANSEWRDYSLIIGLGCIPVLMSVANILSQLLYDDTSSDYFGASMYDPIYGPMGMLTYDFGDDGPDFHKTTRIAIDALILVLLHEATHGFRAHLHFQPEGRAFQPIAYAKAMESDADWGAGYLFVKGLLAGLSPSKTNSLTIGNNELAERLVCASQANLLGFQATRSPADPGATYHLPYTRSRCTVFGAKLAWEESGTLGTDFFDSFYEFLVKLVRCDEVFSSACPGWIGHTDQRSLDDWAIHDHFTLARLAEVHAALTPLDGGPMKAVRPNYPTPQLISTKRHYRSPLSLPFKLKTLTYRLLEAQRDKDN